jgi:hypothetical protein
MGNSTMRRAARLFSNNSEPIHDTYRQPSHSNSGRQPLMHVLKANLHKHMHRRSSPPDHVTYALRHRRLNCRLPTRYVNVALDYQAANRS